MNEKKSNEMHQDKQPDLSQQVNKNENVSSGNSNELDESLIRTVNEGTNTGRIDRTKLGRTGSDLDGQVE